MFTRATVWFSLSVLVASALQAQEPTLSDVMQKLDGIDAKITSLADRVTKNETRLDGLEAKVNDIASRLSEFEERQRQILVATSSGDVLDIRSQMQKPPFRTAFDSAVQDVLREKTGKFTVTNKMSTYQRITVNGVEYGLNPGDPPLEIVVPAGNVTTELPGQDAKSWTVAAPDYAQRIDIVPSKQWTTYYRAPSNVAPVTPMYTSYYSPTWTTTYYREPVYTSPVVVNYTPLSSWWSY